MNKLIVAFLMFVYLNIAPCQHVSALSYSYLYIQGDKQTPFYVKVNGTMQARYGKNYCIIPKLDSGTIQIEILFQQNIYPPQNYQVRIPENAGKGYLLAKKGDAYALYDLDTKNYLLPAKP